MDLDKLHRDTTMMVAIDREDDASAQKPDRHQDVKDRLNIKVGDLDRVDGARKGADHTDASEAPSGGETVLDDVIPVEKPVEEQPTLMPPLPLAIKGRLPSPSPSHRTRRRCACWPTRRHRLEAGWSL